MRVAGYGDTDNALNVKKNFKHFAPRTGVSWRLNEKTVVRAGYGASTIPFPDNRYAFNYPVKQNYNGSAANGFQNAGSMAAGFPGAGAARHSVRTGSSRSAGALLNATFDVIPTDLHEGTLHSWNVAFQRQLPFLLTADIAYVGNRGVDLVMDVDTNASTDLRLRQRTGSRSSRQFNRTGANRTRTNLNKSQYNGAADEDRSPVPQRVPPDQLVHAQPLDDYVNENGGIATPIDFEQSWARSNFDRTHNYVLTGALRAAVGAEQAVAERAACSARSSAAGS